MIFDLGKIQKEKPVELQLDVEKRQGGDPSFPFQVQEGHLAVTLKILHEDFLMTYEVKARVEAPCSRCGQTLDFGVVATGRLVLRLRQPEETHLVLKPNDLDVRFLGSPELDLMQFFDEQIELEIPQFPRHDSGQSCLGPEIEFQDKESGTDPETNPFSALRDLL